MELQLALLLLGMLIVAAVALTAYDRVRIGRWFEMLKPRAWSAERDTRAARASVSGLDINPGPIDEGSQKVLRPQPALRAVSTPRPGARLREELESAEQAAMMPLNLDAGLALRLDEVSPRDRPHMPDDKIDFVITLPGRNLVPRDQALGIYKQQEYLLDKPHKIYGLHKGSGLWSNLERDPETAEYSQFALALQLVDTHGAASESEINTFAQLGLSMADMLRRRTLFSMTFEDAIARAQDLNQFCEAYDVVATLNVISNHIDGFRGPLIERVAMRQGMEFGARDIFHMKNDNAWGCRHLFSMASMFKPGHFDLARMQEFRTQGLTLFMTVPCVYSPLEVFDKMVSTAKGFCRMLGGKLLDHDRRPLSDQGLAHIRVQIQQIAADMRAKGVVPGSLTAIRLFSDE